MEFVDKNDEEFKDLYLEYKKKYNILKKKLEKRKNKNITKDLKVGDILIYKPTNEKVTLLKIHYDDITPYYTIKMPDDREKQTVLDKLIKEFN